MLERLQGDVEVLRVTNPAFIVQDGAIVHRVEFDSNTWHGADNLAPALLNKMLFTDSGTFGCVWKGEPRMYTWVLESAAIRAAPKPE